MPTSRKIAPAAKARPAAKAAKRKPSEARRNDEPAAMAGDAGTPRWDTLTATALKRELPPPVNWQFVANFGYALARSLTPGTSLRAFERFLLAITEPLRQLDALHQLAVSALSGNPDATESFARLVEQMTEASRERDALRRPPGAALEASETSCACAQTPADPDVSFDRTSAERTASEAEPALLNEKGLAGLFFAIARLRGDCQSLNFESALNAVLDIVNSAGLAAELFKAHIREGSGAIGHVFTRRIALLPEDALQLLRAAMGAPPMMMMMMMDFGGVPDIPLPHGPKLPTPPGMGDLFPKGDVGAVLAKLRRRHEVDPDHLDPNFIIHRDYQYVDYWNRPFFRCIRAAKQLLDDRTKILPPAPPLMPVWAFNITSVVTSGPCAGARVTIHGENLKAPGAVLLVPFADGCHVVPVDPAKWTNASVEFILPPGAISGPVGFGDGAYIKAYNAWAAEQNRLAEHILALGCLFPNLPWVAPFRRCPPDLGANRIVAGSPVIDSFTANGESVLVLGGPVTLAWKVRNASEVRISTVGTGGPLPGSGADLVNPAGTSVALGMVTASRPTAFTYQLTAKGPCGEVVKDVTVVVSRRPKLFIESVELTQGIQTIPASVKLVDGKPVVLRVTVRHGLNGWGDNNVPNVTGRIQARNQGVGFSFWLDAANDSSPMSPNPGANITVVAFPKRLNTNDTLNFYVPLDFSTWTCRYAIEVRVSGFGAVGPFAGFDDEVSFDTDTFAFEKRKTLEIRYGQVSVNGQPASTAQQCVNAILGGAAMLPMPAPNIAALPMAVRALSGGTSKGIDAYAGGKIAFVNALEAEHDCMLVGSLNPPLVCPDPNYWVFVTGPSPLIGGQAYGIPSKTLVTDPTPVIVAHEMAHCLNQKHVNWCGAQGGDAAVPTWNGGRIADVPFDPVQNAVVKDATNQSWELMTYCSSRWPAPLRWEALFDFIGS